MSQILLAVKQNMTQVFLADGQVVPVTVLKAEPSVVTQLKTVERDGYESVQLGFGKLRHTKQAILGHIKSAGVTSVRYLREFKIEIKDLTIGQKFDVTQFKVGDKVSVQGISKGRGFQGVVKRHGFHGHPSTHGHKDQLRMPGSIGAGGKQHVMKGKRMAGHMGTDKVTVHNLEIMGVNPELNEIMVKGAVPGARNGLIYLQNEAGK